MPSFSGHELRVRRRSAVVAFPDRSAPKWRDAVLAEGSPFPDMALVGITDVRGAMAETVFRKEMPWTGSAMVLDLVSGATVSGGGGQDMTGSEIGEPRSVSGAAVGRDVPEATPGRGAAAVVVMPCPAPDVAVRGGAADLRPTDAHVVMTSQVELADRAVIAFGMVIADERRTW